MGSAVRLYSRKDKDLLNAIRTDDLRLFNVALEKGAAINKAFDYGWTPLHWASFKGNLTMVEILRDRGAKTKQKNNDKNTPADICCWDGGDPTIRKKIMIVLQEE
jgi:ankyrin repeat protein